MTPLSVQQSLFLSVTHTLLYYITTINNNEKNQGEREWNVYPSMRVSVSITALKARGRTPV